jgi:hypothetical protein
MKMLTKNVVRWIVCLDYEKLPNFICIWYANCHGGNQLVLRGFERYFVVRVVAVQKIHKDSSVYTMVLNILVLI